MRRIMGSPSLHFSTQCSAVGIRAAPAGPRLDRRSVICLFWISYWQIMIKGFSRQVFSDAGPVYLMARGTRHTAASLTPRT